MSRVSRPPASADPVWRTANQPRFVRVQLQSEPRQSFPKFFQEPLGFLPMLESRHEVVRKPHDKNIAPGLRVSPLLDPHV
jgi:hypothetical protein